MIWGLLVSACGLRGPTPSFDPVATEAVWLEAEPGKELCLPTFPDVPWPRRRQADAFALAVDALRVGDLVTARANLDLVPHEHPARRAAVAVADLMEGRHEEPAVVLSALATAHPGDVCVASTASLALWADGHQDEAAALLLDARELAALDGRLAFLSWYLELEPGPELVDALDHGLQRQPDHPGLQLARGITALQLGDAGRAVPLLQAALEAGLVEAEGPLLQAYFRAGRRPAYLRLASRLGLPLGDGGGLATAPDPEVAYDALVGRVPGTELGVVLRTSMGDLHCVLWPDAAPVTVANFVGLARGTLPWRDLRTGEVVERPLYNGTVFHRVVPGFMVQGGDPLGSGTGGPGYAFVDEVSEVHRFDRAGVLAMANRGPHTNGSQFFVTEVPAPHLDGLHTIFGQCDAAAVDVVTRIARVPSRDMQPLEPVSLEAVAFEAR